MSAARLIVAAVGLVVFQHLLMTVLYLLPANVAKRSLGEKVQAYMEPLFYQNWHLFSPDPGISSTHMVVRCQNEDGQWTSWLEPNKPLQDRIDRNRVSSFTKLIYVYRGIPTGLQRDLNDLVVRCLEEAQEDPNAAAEAVETCNPRNLAPLMQGSESFELAARYAAMACNAVLQTENQGLSSVQFQVLQFFALQYTERHLAEQKPWSRVVEVTFPEVPVSFDVGAAW